MRSEKIDSSTSLKGKLVLLSPIAMRQSLSLLVSSAVSAGIYYLFIIIPKENIYWVLLVISALIVFVLAFAGLARLMRKTNPNRRN